MTWKGIAMTAAFDGAAHQLNAIRDVVRRDVDRSVKEAEGTFGLTKEAADQVAEIGRDERMFDEIRASRIRPEHIRMMQLRFPHFSEPECIRRIVRGMDLFDCEPFDAVECLTALLALNGSR